ncbi:MAG: HEAT repeat domain-containing protein [bacterium]
MSTWWKSLFTSQSSRRIGLLDSSDWSTRQKAAEDLGKSQDRRAVAALIKKVNDDGSGIQEAAMIALGKIGDSIAVQHILPELDTKGEPTEAAAHLAKLNGEEATMYLQRRAVIKQVMIVTRLNYSREHCHERAVSQSKFAVFLGHHTQQGLIDRLRHSQEGSNFEARVALERIQHNLDAEAKTALSTISASELVELRRDILAEDSKWFIRNAAAEALGRLGDPASIPQLTEHLHDTDSEVRATCAQAIGAIKSRERTSA